MIHYNTAGCGGGQLLWLEGDGGGGEEEEHCPARPAPHTVSTAAAA